MVILADITRTDGVALKLCEAINSPYPILLISRQENLNFNEQILSLKGQKYVIADFIEVGWNWNREETLIIGKNIGEFKDCCQSGWERLDEFIKENPPVLYFKRELLKKDATAKVLPIEYPNWQKEYPTQTREQFNARPISVLNYWGRSHEARLIVHGEIWKNAARKGYAVCDNIYYINHFMREDSNINKWVSLWIPHYARIDISEILKINEMSKLCISLPGAGVKCFRQTGEAVVNGIVVMPEDNLEYSYPFVNNVNCIKFPIETVTGVDKEWGVIEAVEKALLNNNLYDIYLESLLVAEFYRVDNYTKYIENLINKA